MKKQLHLLCYVLLVLVLVLALVFAAPDGSNTPSSSGPTDTGSTDTGSTTSTSWVDWLYISTRPLPNVLFWVIFRLFGFFYDKKQTERRWNREIWTAMILVGVPVIYEVLNKVLSFLPKYPNGSVLGNRLVFGYVDISILAFLEFALPCPVTEKLTWKFLLLYVSLWLLMDVIGTSYPLIRVVSSVLYGTTLFTLYLTRYAGQDWIVKILRIFPGRLKIIEKLCEFGIKKWFTEIQKENFVEAVNRTEVDPDDKNETITVSVPSLVDRWKIIGVMSIYGIYIIHAVLCWYLEDNGLHSYFDAAYWGFHGSTPSKASQSIDPSSGGSEGSELDNGSSQNGGEFSGNEHKQHLQSSGAGTGTGSTSGTSSPKKDDKKEIGTVPSGSDAVLISSGLAVAISAFFLLI